MDIKPTYDESLESFKLRLCEEKYNKRLDEKETWDTCAELINDYYGTNIKNGESLRSWYKKHRNRNAVPIKPTEMSNYKETIEINKDGTQTSDKLIKMAEEQSKDVNFLLKAHGYDTKSWLLVSARNNIWNVQSKTEGIKTLYSSKITVKPSMEFAWSEDNVRNIFKSLKTDYKNKVNVTPKQYEKNENLLVVPIADFHFNLLSDKYSTGNDYNIEIAEQSYYYTLNDIVSRVGDKKFEKVLFVVGNDFINADNLNGTTTKGTPQDNSTEWFNTVRKATKLVIDGIDILTHIAPVDVQYVMSNHDLHTMFGIMQTVEAWYRDDDYVNVDSSPLARKYYKFGETLIGLSHDIKVKDALKLMTSEAKNEWGKCTHMIWMLAHLHQSMIYDKQGYLEILRLPTISGWSRWTNTMGYIQSDKRNQTFIVHKKLGITDILNTVIKDG